MKLLAFDVPEDPSRLPSWLESQLTGLDLGQLVAELSAIHSREAPNGLRLQNILGDRQERVLQNGLGELPQESLRQLLLHPRLLLELQELVLIGGGPYWQRVKQPSNQMSEQLVRGLQGLERLWAGNRMHASESRVDQGQPRIRSIRERLAWSLRPWAVSLATAAAVLLGVFVYHYAFPPTTSPATVVAAASWGWSKPGALPEDVSANAFLNKLAEGAEEWFQRRPVDAANLAKRIQELRQGCSTLIFAEKKPLKPEDRQWLVERCRKWAETLDAHVADLESGAKPEEVLANADDTVRKFVATLREKAKEVGQG
jgi:hypothetical protein